MEGIEPGELGARIRAARAYSGMSLPEMAQQIGVSDSTLKRIESGTAPVGGRLRGIVDVTGVPPDFFEVGFAPFERPLTDVGRRLYQLEARFADFSVTVAQLADDASRGDLGAAAQRLRVLAQKLQDRPLPSTRPAEGVPGDSGG